MGSTRDEEDVATTYAAQLMELKVNSKPVINVLTMMAEDYIRHAPIIVRTIERHLNTVHTNIKLPILYLIDSIVKNVKVSSVYPELFAENIVHSFCRVFEKVKVDEKVKIQMHKLRLTWNEVFPQRKLYQLDVQCRTVDKNWPISATPGNSVHVNPKFINPVKVQSASVTVHPAQPDIKVSLPDPILDTSLTPTQRAEIEEKRRELFELQKRKIELEIIQTKAAIETTKLHDDVQYVQLHEKVLMEQALMAKTKTHMANQILSTVGKEKSAKKPPVALQSSLDTTLTKAPPSSSPIHGIIKEESFKSKSYEVPNPHFKETGIIKPSRQVVPKQESRSPSIKKEFQLIENSKPSRSRSSSHSSKDDGTRGKRKAASPSRASVHKESKSSRSSVSSHSSREESSSREKSKSSPSTKDKGDSPTKSVSSLSTSSHSSRESKSMSPTKVSERQRTDKLRKEKERSSSSKDKRREEKHAKLHKTKRSDPENEESSTAPEPEERDRISFDARRSAVLKRNYRRQTGVEVEEDKLPMKTDGVTADVDLRFHDHKDDEEPLGKRNRPSGTEDINDLFGREDVDLRQSRSGNWSQVKTSRGGDPRLSLDRDATRGVLQDTNRPLPPVSPATSVSSVRSGCDPLGRPLLYNRLPDDPEERKRSLDSQPMDPLDSFRKKYIDKVLRERGNLDIGYIFRKGKELLNAEQFRTIMKEVEQINEAKAIEEVQQRQRSELGWQNSESPSPAPNPWQVAMPSVSQGPWVPGFQPKMPTEIIGRPGFPGWQPPTVPDQWIQALPEPSGPNPFEQALMTQDMIPPANELELRNAERDNPSSIPIDKIMRQVRFYGDTAIILMGQMEDDPRQLSFKREYQPRTILINGKPMEIRIGDVKQFGNSHAIKIGAPTRELYIDDRHYELFFGGGPIRIPVDNRVHTFELTEKPPEVEIGKVPRHDLIAGRVTLIVDAVQKIKVFLDEKPQKLDEFSQPVVLRFTDNFHTVCLNGRPFPTRFGYKLPFSITIPNAGQHWVRFTALPPSTEKAIGHFAAAKMGLMEPSGELGFRGRNPPLGRRGRRGARGGREPLPVPAERIVPAIEDRNPLDMLNFFPTRVPERIEDRRLRRSGESFNSYESEHRDTVEDKDSGSDGDGMDVSNLLALAAKFGIIPTSSTDTKGQSPRETVEEEGTGKTEVTGGKKQIEKKEKTPEKPQGPPPIPTVDVLLVSEDKNNLKERRQELIDQLWIGVQCASCGLRFPPDQAVRYSQHLDWHFRRNRREKANAKKAQSRPWYYDYSDWIQFIEVEEIEERAQSLFEKQGEAEGETESPTGVKPEECTVPASSHSGAICPQCRETFSSYYDEDKDEWRLKDAVLDEVDNEEKLYHYFCHQDYLKSLVEESVSYETLNDVDDATKGVEEEEEKENVPEAAEEEEEEVLIIREGPKEVVLMEIDVDDEEGLNDLKSDHEKNKETGKSPIPLKETSDSNESTTATDKIVPSYSVISKEILSPIVVNDDSSSNMLPGISEDSVGGVFGVALGSGICRSESPEAIEEKRIVYKSMEFDFPTIKVEPPDNYPEDLPDSVEVGVPPILEVTPATSEPIEITLEDADDAIDLTTEEDDVDGPPRVLGHSMSIDGNLQQSVPVPFAPAVKIRINISGLDAAKSPKSPQSPKIPEAEQPSTETAPEPSSPKEKEGGASPASSDTDKTKPNADVEFTEELKLLKPRLYGRKLVNCPPKRGNKEESGLCVIS